jgi:tyrosyl-tRNA synthetase
MRDPVTKNLMENKEQLIDEILSRGVAEVIDREHLKKRLLEGKPLRIKLGIDPTSPNIHLGRSVPLLKLRDFQDLGHTVVFIVGDFTGQIGDTSDKDSERPILSEDVVKKNMETYLAQAWKILDPKKTEVHHNSEWFSEMKFWNIGLYADAFSVAEFTARENIKKRMDEGKRVSLREMLYPVFQGIDSLKVDADVELGGTDQRFNLLAGRKLQSVWGDEPQDILMTNLILGTDGRKMSSSWGNTINLTDVPNEMFGKVMSVPDNLITDYFVHCTRVPMTEIDKMAEEMVTGGNPRDAKVRLAKEIVRLYHGAAEADKAEQYFIETFSKGTVPDEVQTVTVVPGTKLTDMLAEAGLAESKGDARRKADQGGVSIDGVKLPFDTVLEKDQHDGKVVKVGKKDFIKITFSV